MITEEFSTRVAIVTGAGAGIGYGICQALAQAGAYVTLNDIDGELARKAAAAINLATGNESVTPFAQDIADAAAVGGMIDQVAARHGRLDIVVANAGITNFGPFLEYTPEAFDRVVAVNLRGTYFTAQAAARQMIALGANEGRIILMSSVTGVQAYRYLSAYGMTKAAIRHLASLLAVELGQYGITVNAVSPGATVTERTLADDPEYARNWAAVLPTHRVGQVADVVQAVLYLASSGARQVTGQTLVVDGGWTVTSQIPEDTPDLPVASSQLR
jgi:3-oxoacyl-[acyl-carrier protein] reductase